MLAEVSPARIEARIRKLVSFGTRHTLSDIASDTRGSGAARRWITAELTACSKAAHVCGVTRVSHRWSSTRITRCTTSWYDPP
jgi:hypothetical protein